jgi:Dihydrouridine synthase (Dus)
MLVCIQLCGRPVQHTSSYTSHINVSPSRSITLQGCPQRIARRGFYGAFLYEEPQLVFDMVRLLHDFLDIPITCKIRVLEQGEEATIRYAKMLERAGCQLLCVHGRTRIQKGPNEVPADWALVRKIRLVLLLILTHALSRDLLGFLGSSGSGGSLAVPLVLCCSQSGAPVVIATVARVHILEVPRTSHSHCCVFAFSIAGKRSAFRCL